MLSLPAFLRPLVARAAELRAGGASWDAVAAKLRRSANTVSRWPSLYPDAWAAELRRAADRFAADAAAEAVLVLRSLLRSDDDKIKRDAGRLLLRLRPRPSTDPAPSGTGESAQLAAYLGGLSDDEVTAILDEYRSRPAGTGGPDPATDGGPGPDRPE
jgi:hypothetical protein